MKRKIFSLILLCMAIQYGKALDKSKKVIPGITVDSVQSADGTSIGFYQLGSGPGVIVWHGSFQYSLSHLDLARILSHSYTVYLPDRRGRGLSPYPTNEYDIQKDIDDLNAIAQKKNVDMIFAVSSGAIIALRAAQVNPALRRLAIYEPPLMVDVAKVAKASDRFDKEISDGRVSDALVTSMKAGKMGPPIFNIMPRFLLRSFTEGMMKREESKSKPDDVTIRKIAPTLHHDIQIILQNARNIEQFKNVKVKTLLLGGSKSPAYLKSSLAQLQKTLPNAMSVELPRLNHGGTGNEEYGGKPEIVAREVIRFFSD